MGGIQDLLRELAVARDAATREEPRELHLIRQGYVKTGAGTYGQWFSTYHDIHHDLRWFTERVFPLLLQAARGRVFSLVELRALTRLMIGRRMDFIGWLGLELFAHHTDRLLDSLEEIESVQEFEQCILALHLYADRLYAWTTHYYPWGAIGLFPLRSKEELVRDLHVLTSAQ